MDRESMILGTMVLEAIILEAIVLKTMVPETMAQKNIDPRTDVWRDDPKAGKDTIAEAQVTEEPDTSQTNLLSHVPKHGVKM